MISGTRVQVIYHHIFLKIELKKGLTFWPSTNLTFHTSCLRKRHKIQDKHLYEQGQKQEEEMQKWESGGDVNSCKNATCGGLMYKAYAWS